MRNEIWLHRFTLFAVLANAPYCFLRIVQFGSGAGLAFQLTDNTQVSQVGGLFKAGRKQTSMAALIPELQVKAEGRYTPERMLVAIRVTFSGGDLEHGQAIKAGTHEVKVQAQQNQEQLEKHNAELKAHNEALQEQQAQLGLRHYHSKWQSDEPPSVCRHASAGAGLRDGLEPQALTHGAVPSRQKDRPPCDGLSRI